MSAAVIASTSYTVTEGTYTVEVLEEGGTAANNDLRLLEKPRRREKRLHHPLYGVVQKELRARIHDVGRLLTDKILQNVPLKLRISGAYTWEGWLRAPEKTRKMRSQNPIIDLAFVDGVQERLQGLSYDLTGKKEMPKLFYQLLAPISGPSTLRMAWGWNHSGQLTETSTGVSRRAHTMRLPTGTISFGGDEESYYDILEGLLLFFNAELRQHGGRWLIRHRSWIGDPTMVVDWDGSSYSYNEVSWAFPADDSTLLRRVNDQDVDPERPLLAPTGDLTSHHIADEYTPLRNVAFDDWTSAEPDHWDVETGPVDDITKNGESWLRTSTWRARIRQQATQPVHGGMQTDQVKIVVEIKTSSDAPDGRVYNVEYAQVRLRSTPQGAFYMNNLGDWQSSEYRHSVSFEVGNDVLAGEVYRKELSLSPGTYPDAGTQEILLLFDYDETQGTPLDWIQWREARWDVEYDPSIFGLVVGYRVFYAGAGSEDQKMETTLGDYKRKSPEVGTIEYYDGSTWNLATGDWSDPDVSSPSIHHHRLLDRRRQRRFQLMGLRAHFDRSTVLDGARTPSFDGARHVGHSVDGQLGQKATRLETYPLASFDPAADDAHITSVREDS